MEQIKNNPYRTLGLLVGSGVKEERSKRSRLKMLIEAGEDIPEGFSFPALGAINRDINAIEAAYMQLDLGKDRVNCAIFWFYIGSIADEHAFDCLKEGKINAAIDDCWDQVSSSESITKTNSSAFQNLSTLKLHIAFNGASVNFKVLEEAIALKLKYLDSEFSEELVLLSTDEKFVISREDLQKEFLNQLQQAIEKCGGISIDRYFEIINKISFSAKQGYLQAFIKKPMELVEKLISDAAEKRDNNAVHALNTANFLIRQSAVNFEQIKSTLGADSIKFLDICDKLAEELLACAEVYFEYYLQSQTRQPFELVLKLLGEAKKIALSEFVKLRVIEYMELVKRRIGDFEEIGKPKTKIDGITSKW